MARPAVLLQHALYTTRCVTCCSSPTPFLAPLPPLSLLFCPSWFSLGAHPGTTQGFGRGVVGVGGVGLTPPQVPVPRCFPLGGGDACTPRQSVTLLYGPSICPRFVQMDLRRSQVLRPFPKPGFGTL